MESICGTNCNECKLYNKKCNGCNNTKGCPFGKKCFIYNYIDIGGKESFIEFKNKLIDEINSLNIEGMSKIKDLFPLNGSLINMEYKLPNGTKTTFLHDDEIYLGNQVEFKDPKIKKCFGIVANMNFILICEYEENGLNPEIILYKKR